MFRRSSGDISFSWSRLVLNAVPNFTNYGSPEADADVPPLAQDKLYVYQISLPDPPQLDPAAFYYADIARRERDSARIHAGLVRGGILSPRGDIRTSAIDRGFAKLVPWLSQFAQRRVVGLLFFWEQEAARLRQLQNARVDVEAILSGLEAGSENGPDVVETRAALAAELDRLERERKTRPTERIGWERSGGVAAPSAPLSRRGGTDEALPQYS